MWGLPHCAVRHVLACPAGTHGACCKATWTCAKPDASVHEVSPPPRTAHQSTPPTDPPVSHEPPCGLKKSVSRGRLL
jgi:hypothetical protein